MQLPTKGQTVAFGRHVVSYSMGALSMGVALHVVSQGDAKTVGDALTTIFTSIMSIVSAVGALAAVGMGVWASIKSSPLAQLLATSKLPEVAQIVVKDPAVAKALPANVIAAPLKRPGQN